MKFLSKIGTEFDKSNQDYIFISDLTDFDWDYVCLSSSDGLGHYLSINIASKKVVDAIKGARMAVIFLKDRELVKLLDFRNSEKLILNGELIMWRGHFKEKYCLENKNASFKIVKNNEFKELSLQLYNKGK